MRTQTILLASIALVLLVAAILVSGFDKPTSLMARAISVQPAQASTPTLTVRAFVDGRSQLVLQGNTVHWRHLDFAAPGRHQGANEPTLLNGAAWLPAWPDQPDAENRDCHCDSSSFVGAPPLAAQSQTVALQVVQARENVTIVQQPDQSNGFTLIVEFDDNPPQGPDWYEVGLTYATTQEVTPTFTPTPTSTPMKTPTPPPPTFTPTPPDPTSTRPPTSAFLDLPIEYKSYTNFARAARGNTGGRNSGRVNSWFDHTYPDYAKNENITLWSGAQYNGATCTIGVSCYDGHNGIDFQRRGQNEVLAAAPGAVIRTIADCQEGHTSCGNGYGNQVWIDHNNGYATLYGHLKTVSVSVGMPVAMSQMIGIMGNTGNSTGTHLHFSVYYDRNGNHQWTADEDVDPYGWSGPGADPAEVDSQYLWKEPLAEQTAVGNAGATLTSRSGNLQAIVPPGAVTSTVSLQLWDVPPIAQPATSLRSTGHSFWLRVLDEQVAHRLTMNRQAYPTDFTQPFTVTIAYSDTETLHLDESQLVIYRWSEQDSAWTALPTTSDGVRNQAMAQSGEVGNFDLQAPLLCPADNQEPNDNDDTAGLITPNNTPQNHLFDIEQDEDWFKLEAVAGHKYLLSTNNLAAGVDTVLEVYGLDGLTLLAADDDGGDNKASRLQWYAPFSGTYFIRVAQAVDRIHGCSASYRIGVTQEMQLYLPLIQKSE